MNNFEPINDYVLIEPMELKYSKVNLGEGRLNDSNRMARNYWNIEVGKVLSKTDKFKVWDKVFFRKNISARLGKQIAVKQCSILGRYCPYQ